MNRMIDRLKLIFLGIFAVANVGILVWTTRLGQAGREVPGAHKWWDGDRRVCAQPVLTSDITGG